MRNQMGVLEMEGCDLDGRPIIGKAEYPTYTCAHCSKVVVMRPDRERPRTMCYQCGQWICESSEVCSAGCTPLIPLADNGWHDPTGRWTRFLPAIMNGVGSIKEAVRLGLISKGEL